MIGRLGRSAALLAAVFTIGACALPPPAVALNVAKPICTLAGLVSGVAGKVCSAASHAGNALKAGKKLLGGHVGGALKALSGAGTAVKAVTAGAVLASLVGWVAGGAKLVLDETAKVISATTRPQLQSTWFSSTYWRMAAISALLTLPFLFAAVIQAVLRSDMALLARSALGYLPLGMLAVTIAAPITMLLLAGSDELSAIVSGASDGAGGAFLARVGLFSGALTRISGSTFVLLFVGLLTVAATVTLWVELLIRSAAVYVVVLMLPLFFAALVWPARRVWAIRAVELLVALILSKFAIVAVLSLGGEALGHTPIPSATEMLEGATLVMLAAFSPWALLRLLPLHELSSGLDGLRSRQQPLASADARAEHATEIAQALLSQLPASTLQQPGAPPDHAGPADAAVRSLADDAARGAEESQANGVGPAPRSPEPLDPVPKPADSSSPAPVADGTDGRDAPGTDEAPTLGTDGQPAPGPGPADPARGESPAPSATSEPDTRLPGMEPLWQAENDSWRTIHLEPGSLPVGPMHEPERPPKPARDEREPGPPADEIDGARDEHDPRPPAQEPDEGLL